ncbi:MAG TPA: APC family permease [Tepidiformaceae bacterium]
MDLEPSSADPGRAEPTASLQPRGTDGGAGPAAGGSFRRELGLFDFTLLVIGAIVGADVYVVAGLGAQSLGSAQLVSWIAAGILAAFIGLAFVQCAAICSSVGGSYAYAHEAFGPLAGFTAGWALYLGECIALPIFPIAFANYLDYFVPVHSGVGAVTAKLAVVAGVTTINFFGARAGSRLNDVLTLTKLVPLVLLIVAAVGLIFLHPGQASGHLTPFVPLGWGGFGAATVVIFWAYAGFELSVLPSGEVRSPAKTLPRGLIIGMAVATVFYLLTALAVSVALPWQTVAASSRPLADGLEAILKALRLPGGWSAGFMSAGAIISIVGVYDVFTLGLSRLSYALAADGLFPPPFARVNARFGTPWFGLAFQALVAGAAALLFDLSGLIASSVFFLGVCYVITSLAALRLVARSPQQALHVPGLRVALGLAAISGFYLATQVSPPLIAFGIAAMAAGLLAYGIRRKAWLAASAEVRSEEQRFERWVRRGNRWLLRFVRRRHRLEHDPR